MKKTRQAIKDALWRLDEATREAVASLNGHTVRAWQEAVESGNWRRELLEARNVARALFDRVAATVDDLT